VDSDSSNHLDELRAILGAPVDDQLLSLALTHPSAVGEGIERTLHSNQRLEFLGDAVLAAIVAEHLYRSDETLAEGVLTQRKAAGVRGTSLASAAKRLGIGAYLRLGRGEEAAGGRARDSILADAFEAILGAIHLSCGADAARDFVLRALSEELNAVEQNAVNVKNLLQEKTQSVGLGTPVYQTAQRDAGGSSQAARSFSAQVLVSGQVRGRGIGKTKKAAECAAAAAALQAMT